MALKIVLKSGDRLLMGTSTVKVASEGYVTLLIEGDMPVMRESDSLSRDDADTPQRQLCFHLQQAYLTGRRDHTEAVESLLSKELQAGSDWASEVLALTAEGKVFKALKLAQKWEKAVSASTE